MKPQTTETGSRPGPELSVLLPAYNDEAWATFVRRLSYVCVDATAAADYPGLKAQMQPGDVFVIETPGGGGYGTLE